MHERKSGEERSIPKRAQIVRSLMVRSSSVHINAEKKRGKLSSKVCGVRVVERAVRNTLIVTVVLVEVLVVEVCAVLLVVGSVVGVCVVLLVVSVVDALVVLMLVLDVVVPECFVVAVLLVWCVIGVVIPVLPVFIEDVSVFVDKVPLVGDCVGAAVLLPPEDGWCFCSAGVLQKCWEVSMGKCEGSANASKEIPGNILSAARVPNTAAKARRSSKRKHSRQRHHGAMPPLLTVVREDSVGVGVSYMRRRPEGK